MYQESDVCIGGLACLYMESDVCVPVASRVSGVISTRG